MRRLMADIESTGAGNTYQRILLNVLDIVLLLTTEENMFAANNKHRAVCARLLRYVCVMFAC